MNLRSRRTLLLAAGICFVFLMAVFAFMDLGMAAVLQQRLGGYLRLSEPECTRQVIRSGVGDLVLSEDLLKTTDYGNPWKIKRISAAIDRFHLALDTLRFEKVRSNNSETHMQLKRILYQLEEELDVRKFRSKLSEKLGQEIQDRLSKLQNPRDCDSSPRLHCDLRNTNGLASGVHDLLWCFVQAYYSGRLLSVNSDNWHYTPNGWESYFRPLSSKCGTKSEGTDQKTGPGPNDGVNRRLLVKLPVDLADQLLLLGINPLPWWYGQFLGYALQPNAALKDLLEETLRQLDFTSPIVGLHIRRTDKIGTEAALHSVDEYMAEAENYFRFLDLNGSSEAEASGPVRRIFLASDDPSVLDECRSRYPGYRFLSLSNTSNLACNLDTRYEEESVRGALLDIFLLAQTDFLVCTLSSGFCRLAYELMQYNRPYALHDVFSLDTEFFYAYVDNPSQEALSDWPVPSAIWNPEIDISLRRGDVLVQPQSTSPQLEALRGKAHDGLNRGRNQRTGVVGFYPLIHVAPFYEVANYTDDPLTT